MKIKCIYNRNKSSPLYPKKISTINDTKNPSAILSKEFIVYAIEIWQGIPHYCINNYDEKTPFTQFSADFDLEIHPCSCFEIIDNRISRYWTFIHHNNMEASMWAFPEWTNGWIYINEENDYVNEGFYDRLIYGGQKENKIFSKYKEAMDLEFPDNSVTKFAQIGDPNWLLCPFCHDGFENSNKIDALIKCPTCKKISRNPRYENKWPHLDL
ncbi:Uncharacterized protein PHSC3_000961 [Chlamydiales bacterium STE3]|nr:Uncharacterized protein PHSC3_000961 [Chlamydiales bacterium STE3]